MNEAVEATEAIFRITLSGITYVLRIADEINRFGQRSSMDNAAIRGFLSALQSQEQPTKGQVKIEEMLRRGQGLVQFNMREQDNEKFTAAAKEAGLCYSTVCMDQLHKEGERVLTVFVARNDAFTVNNIIELNNINAVQGSSFVQEEEMAVSHDPVGEYETVPPVDYVEPEDRRQILNDAFIAGLEERERINAPMRGKEEPINPTSPEMNQSAPRSENISGSIKKEISITEVYTGGRTEDYSKESRPSIRAQIESLRDKEKEPASLTREEKDRQGMEYINEITKEQTLGR